MTAPAPTCQWKIYNWLLDDSPRICGEPAKTSVTTGCVHEHLNPCPTCERCLPEVKEAIGRGDLLCTPCRDLGGTDNVRVVIASIEELVA